MDGGRALETGACSLPPNFLIIYLSTCVGLLMDGGGALEPEEPPVSHLRICLYTCVGLLMDGGGALEPEEPPVSHLSNIAYHLHIIR